MTREKLLTEPLWLGAARRCLRNWPLPRGKGALLRLCRCICGDKPVVFEVEPGVLIRGELSDYEHQWCFLGEHKRDLAFALSLSMVFEGATVLDIGANVGMWSLCAARRTGNSGVVHAFEPEAANFQRLNENVRLNRFANVICQRRAVGDREGTATFYSAVHGNCGAAGLKPRAGVDEPHQVEITTVDRYCEMEGIGQVHLIKVDVEGAESLVFQGARGLLNSEGAPAVLFETCDSVAAGFASSSSQVKRQLESCGYGVYEWDGVAMCPVDSARPHEFADLFALKPVHFARWGFKERAYSARQEAEVG